MYPLAAVCACKLELVLVLHGLVSKSGLDTDSALLYAFESVLQLYPPQLVWTVMIATVYNKHRHIPALLWLFPCSQKIWVGSRYTGFARVDCVRDSASPFAVFVHLYVYLWQVWGICFQKRNYEVQPGHYALCRSLCECSTRSEFCIAVASCMYNF